MNPSPLTVPLPFATEYVQRFTSITSLFLEPDVYIRYLGILIDCRLMWQSHFTSRTRKLNDRCRLFCPLLTSEHMKPSIKIVLYKLLLRPIKNILHTCYGVLPKFRKSTAIQRFQSEAYTHNFHCSFFTYQTTLSSLMKINVL